jgi:pimeloyl-ACP methyl ester carboxylesterase
VDDDFLRARTTDGQTFVYREVGTGPLVVLFHGFPDTPHSWAGIADRLSAAGYRTVAPWLRGYHPETLVAGRRYDALTIGDDALRFLDAIGEQSAVLVGHDWGASMIYGAASLAPDRTRAIVPIAVPHTSIVRPSPRLAWAVRHFVALRMPWAERAVARGDFAYVDTLYRRWAPGWSGPERDASIRRVKACFADPASLTAAVDYYRAVSPRLPASIEKPPAVPGLVVGGTDDIFDPALITRTAELLAEPSDSLLVPGAGHWPHRQDETGFTDALVAFLAKLEVGGGD